MKLEYLTEELAIIYPNASDLSDEDFSNVFGDVDLTASKKDDRLTSLNGMPKRTLNRITLTDFAKLKNISGMSPTDRLWMMNVSNLTDVNFTSEQSRALDSLMIFDCMRLSSISGLPNEMNDMNITVYGDRPMDKIKMKFPRAIRSLTLAYYDMTVEDLKDLPEKIGILECTPTMNWDFLSELHEMRHSGRISTKVILRRSFKDLDKNDNGFMKISNALNVIEDPFDFQEWLIDNGFGDML